jgi:hypothetical protein
VFLSTVKSSPLNTTLVPPTAIFLVETAVQSTYNVKVVALFKVLVKLNVIDIILAHCVD